MKTLKVLGLLAALTFGAFNVAQADGESCCKADKTCCTKGGDCCKK